MNILFIGSADLSGKAVGGQLERTKLLYEALLLVKKYNVDFVNMYAKAKSRVFFQIITKYFLSDVTVFITSENGTKRLMKILHILKKFTYRPVIFAAIGNQNEVLQSFSQTILKDIDVSFFETEQMAADMKEVLPGCSGYLTNCKMIKTHYQNYSDKKRPIRICYYSEISSRKGFDTVIRVLDKVNAEKIIYELDVYGYFGDDKTEIEKYLDRRYVYFKKIIKRGQTAQILSKYLFMLFLTKHQREGVPGAIVDAYEAGLPVISTDVSYMKYIIKDGKTGYILKTVYDLEGLLLKIADNMKPIIKMRKNCIAEAYKFDISKAVSIFQNKVEELCSRRE